MVLGNIFARLMINSRLLVLVLVLVGCGNGPSESASNQTVIAARVATTTVDDTLTDSDSRMLELWRQSCALCHVDGNGRAPRMGNSGEWKPRLAKGADVLLRHTLEGFKQMPPLGYCMACERDDFVALIDFMTQNMAAEQTSGLAQ